MIDLKTVVRPEDWPAVKMIQDRFEEEAQKTEPERNRLSELSKEALPYEIKYLPDLHRDFLKELPDKDRALLVLVGKRESPILISLAILKPVRAVLLHTAETRSEAESIKASNLIDKQLRLEMVQIDPLQSDKTYQVLVDIVKKGQNNWFCDITAGKKVMGACLGAFGFWRRIPVVYLDSREFKGVPKPFSERLYLIKNPYDCYGDPLLEAAQKSLEGYYFSSAENVLQSLLETTSLQTQYHKTEKALKIVRAYHQWDCFVHSDPKEETAQKFYEDFQQLLELYFRLDYRFLDSETAKKNMKFVQKLKEEYKVSNPSLKDPWRLADVFRNAERRAVQQAFDDAVARLYRCVEMAATLILWKLEPKFNPDSPDWDALRNRYAEIDNLYKQKAQECGIKADGLPRYGKAGLSIQITLAAALGEAVKKSGQQNEDHLKLADNAVQMHQIYAKYDKGDESPFALRNRSILAHGSRPVGEDTFRKFRSAAMKICKLAVGEKVWQELYDEAEFPKFYLTE